tara:strand:+ start:14151 stop:14516 length:366 start_codon:yes stop_codon:yes gene_type:complete
MASKKISDYTPITGGGFGNDDLFDISEHLGSSVYQTRSITGAEIKASFPPVFTIDLIDALTVTFYAPEALSIDSVTDVVNSPTTTILVGGSAYTLGTAITAGQSINVTVSVNAVVNLVTSY